MADKPTKRDPATPGEPATYEVPREDFRVSLARRAVAQSKAGDGELAERWARCETALEMLVWFVDEKLDGGQDDRLDRIEKAVGRVEQALTDEVRVLGNALGADEGEQERHGELITTLTSVRDVLDEHVSVYGQLDTIRRDIDTIRRTLAIAAEGGDR